MGKGLFVADDRAGPEKEVADLFFGPWGIDHQLQVVVA